MTDLAARSAPARHGRLLRGLRRIPASALLGLVLLAVLAGAALLAPWVAPHDPGEVVGEVWASPQAGLPLGTDNLGRDLLSRLIWGARLTVFVAGAATLLSFTVGVLLGFLAAVLRGLADQLLSRLVDLFLAIPTLIFALVVLSVLPSDLVVLILVIAAVDALRVFRVSRSIAADIVVMDYVEAARLRGEGWGYVMLREVLPNAVSPLLAEMGLRFIFAVLFLSTLSFLGLGIQPPTADWGGMVKDNKDGIVFGVSAALIPGAAIAGLAVSVNLVVDWLIGRASSLRGGRDG